MLVCQKYDVHSFIVIGKEFNRCGCSSFFILVLQHFFSWGILTAAEVLGIGFPFQTSFVVVVERKISSFVQAIVLASR